MPPLAIDGRHERHVSIANYPWRGEEMRISPQGFQEGDMTWGQARYDELLKPGWTAPASLFRHLSLVEGGRGILLNLCP